MLRLRGGDSEIWTEAINTRPRLFVLQVIGEAGKDSWAVTSAKTDGITDEIEV